MQIIAYVNKFNVMPHLNVFIYDQLIRNKMQNIREGLTALENFSVKYVWAVPRIFSTDILKPLF